MPQQAIETVAMPQHDFLPAPEAISIERSVSGLSYIPALDGCRALCIVMVVLSHFGFGKIVPGLLGVTLFFLISGYLITSLLLEESAQKGSIDIRNFYARRAIRLYPAMISMVVVGTTLYVALGGTMTMRDLLAAFFYGANYHIYPQTVGPLGLHHPFQVMWSLAVEEHFYLVFPFIVLLLRKRLPALAWTTGLLIVGVTLWRFHVAADCRANPGAGLCALPMRIEQGTDTRVDSILFGSLMAVMVRTRAEAALRRLLDHRTAFAVGIVLLLASLGVRNEYFRDTLRFLCQPLGLFLCVGSLLFSRRMAWLNRGLSHPLLLRTGRWSYSIYLWHSIVLVGASGLLARSLWQPISDNRTLHSLPALVAVLGLIAASIVLAAMSYVGIERPMVRLRRRFGSHAVADRAIRT